MICPFVGVNASTRIFTNRCIPDWNTFFVAQFVGVTDKDIQISAIDAVGGHHKVLKLVDSTGASDDNVVTVPTSKGGIRRKHHRAWTLSEVMKLVEGVSRYGAGRWSEIKRLAFASYSYRTSVDLKVFLYYLCCCLLKKYTFLQGLVALATSPCGGYELDFG